jgi:tetratricopeptide (TPR) repeat protein
VAKIAVFSLLWYLTGSPFLALLILIIILYLLDRRFIGLTPSLVKPLRRRNRMAKLKEELRSNPYHTSSKLELARGYIEQKNYLEGKRLLEDVIDRMEDSADVHAELGLCELKLGHLEAGEKLMERALELNPRVKYGEPYLRLAEAFAGTEPVKAIALLQQFRGMHSSSCEAYYRLGQLYEQLGRKDEAKQAYRETLDVYRSLPAYGRRQQRRWALLAKFK